MFDIVCEADVVNALLIRHHTLYMCVYAIMYTVCLQPTLLHYLGSHMDYILRPYFYYIHAILYHTRF